MPFRRALQSVLSTAVLPTSTWLAEIAVVSVLENIEEGELRIITPTHSYSFGKPLGKEQATLGSSEFGPVVLHVKNDTFWLRLCLMGDLGFSEAFMYGEAACEDLIPLFMIFLRNKSRLEQLNSRFAFLFSIPQKISNYRFLNTLSNSRSNISAHYDISNDMFAGFLSKDMTYSCAIFEDLDSDSLGFSPECPKSISKSEKAVNGIHASHANGVPKLLDDNVTNGETDIAPYPEDVHQYVHTNGTNGMNMELGNGNANGIIVGRDVLEEAQIRKIDHIIRLANIQPGCRVLEIGSGWGALSLRIATNPALPGVTIDTITLSSQQLTLARQRMAEAGADVANRVRVHLMDYRAMPAEWEGRFDRVISVEMIEAVGKEFMEEYWGVVDWAMKKEDGVGVVQCITIPESRYEKYSQEIDFIRKWVLFPGGMLPSISFLHQTLTAGSKGRLVVESVSNIGPHYARTLREWRIRFLENFDRVIAPALRKEHPEITQAGADRAEREVQVFKRKWLYYFCYCEVGFTTRTLGDHIIAFTREGNKSYGCKVFN